MNKYMEKCMNKYMEKYKKVVKYMTENGKHTLKRTLNEPYPIHAYEEYWVSFTNDYEITFYPRLCQIKLLTDEGCIEHCENSTDSLNQVLFIIGTKLRRGAAYNSTNKTDIPKLKNRGED